MPENVDMSNEVLIWPTLPGSTNHFIKKSNRWGRNLRFL